MGIHWHMNRCYTLTMIENVFEITGMVDPSELGRHSTGKEVLMRNKPRVLHQYSDLNGWIWHVGDYQYNNKRQQTWR